MVKVVVNGSITEVKEEGFTLRIHPDGEMYVRHPCNDDPEGIALVCEMIEGVCAECGEINMPDALKAVWTLYNFDSIQRGER